MPTKDKKEKLLITEERLQEILDSIGVVVVPTEISGSNYKVVHQSFMGYFGAVDVFIDIYNLKLISAKVVN
jgi:cytochrome oxidase Cu insertion factor (SCO1/SenC/PrrC family)